MTRLLLLTLLAPSLLAAQAPVHLTAGWRAAFERARTRSVDGPELLSGYTLGGEATATRGRLALRVRYGQGNLSPDSATGRTYFRRLAEGELLVGVRAASWLALWTGPHARSYRTALGTQRWLFWEAHAQVRGMVLADRLTSYLEAWQALGGRVKNVPEPFASATGAEGGLEFRLPGRALTWRLSYRLEQARHAGGDRRETAESLALGILLDFFK